MFWNPKYTSFPSSGAALVEVGGTVAPVRGLSESFLVYVVESTPRQKEKVSVSQRTADCLNTTKSQSTHRVPFLMLKP